MPIVRELPAGARPGAHAAVLWYRRAPQRLTIGPFCVYGRQRQDAPAETGVPTAGAAATNG